jgi:hypothetical protein
MLDQRARALRLGLRIAECQQLQGATAQFHRCDDTERGRLGPRAPRQWWPLGPRGNR